MGLFDSNAHLTKLHALALAETDSMELAIDTLLSLRKSSGSAATSNTFDTGACALLARCYRDAALLHLDPDLDFEQRLTYISAACDLYSSGFAKEKLFFWGINAATMLHLLERKDEAKKVAGQVATISETEITAWGGLTRAPEYQGAFRALTAFGDAHVILGSSDKAEVYYAAAVGLAQKSAGESSGATTFGLPSARKTSAMKPTRLSLTNISSAKRGLQVLLNHSYPESTPTGCGFFQQNLFNLPGQRIAVCMSAEMHHRVLPISDAQDILRGRFNTLLEVS